VQVLGTAAQLPLGLTDEIDQHGNGTHEQQSESPESARDDERQLTGLEVLPSGLPPSEPDGGPTTDDEDDSEI
jgi:hypothetical protein